MKVLKFFTISVRSCLLIPLIKCLKGHKSLGSLCNVWLLVVTEGPTKGGTRCPIELLWTAKNWNLDDFLTLFLKVLVFLNIEEYKIGRWYKLNLYIFISKLPIFKSSNKIGHNFQQKRSNLPTVYSQQSYSFHIYEFDSQIYAWFWNPFLFSSLAAIFVSSRKAPARIHSWNH